MKELVIKIIKSYNSWVSSTLRISLPFESEITCLKPIRLRSVECNFVYSDLLKPVLGSSIVLNDGNTGRDWIAPSFAPCLNICLRCDKWSFNVFVWSLSYSFDCRLSFTYLKYWDKIE